MTISRTLVSSTAAIALLGTSACVTDPNTGDQKASRTGIGAVAGGVLGAVLGGVIGGDAARIIGAGIGGSAGALIGKRFDDQIRELDEELEGTGVDVEEIGDGDAILVRLPDGVTFASGSADINPGFYDALNAIANSMVQYPNSLVDVYGFTDTTGSDALNLRLSEQRAEAVANYLSARGVARSRFATRGYGESYDYLRVKTADGVAESLNRRVEIKIIPISQEQVQEARAR